MGSTNDIFLLRNYTYAEYLKIESSYDIEAKYTMNKSAMQLHHVSRYWSVAEDIFRPASQKDGIANQDMYACQITDSLVEEVKSHVASLDYDDEYMYGNPGYMKDYDQLCLAILIFYVKHYPLVIFEHNY